MQFCRVMSLAWHSMDEKPRGRRRLVRKFTSPFPCLFFPTTGISIFRHQWAKVRIFFPTTALSTNGIKIIIYILGGLPQKEKKISFPLPKSISRMKGVFCIWKNSRKHLAQFIREKQKIKQLRKKKEWWNKFWKITKVQLEKLPIGEKAPQWPGKRKVQVCYILLWDQKDREEKWPQFIKRAIKVSLDTLKQTVSMQTGDTLVLYGRIYCNLRQ